MSKSKADVNSLLIAIQRNAPAEQQRADKAGEVLLAATNPKQDSESSERVALPESTQEKAKPRSGKPVQFWFYDEDRRVLRDLAAWLAGQGVRSTDSIVVRAALRSVQRGPAFLEAYRAAAQLDGRLKKD